MYAIFKFLFVVVALVAGAWWVLVAILAIFDPGTFLMGPPAIILVGAPLLIGMALLPLRLLYKRNRSRLKRMIASHLEEQGLPLDRLGPIVASDEKASALAFYEQTQVILVSAQGGERYTERFDIDELGWREIRNSRGEYLGVEAFPPANARPKGGTLKIWSGWNIPGEARAIYGTNGIPLP